MNICYRLLEKFTSDLAENLIKESIAESASLNWKIPCSGHCNQKLCIEDFKRSLKHAKIDEKTLLITDYSSDHSNLSWVPESLEITSKNKLSKHCSLSLSLSYDSLPNSKKQLNNLVNSAVSDDDLFYTNKPYAFKYRYKKYVHDDDYSHPVDMIKSTENPKIIQPKVIINYPQNQSSGSSCPNSNIKKIPAKKLPFYDKNDKCNSKLAELNFMAENQSSLRLNENEMIKESCKIIESQKDYNENNDVEFKSVKKLNTSIKKRENTFTSNICQAFCSIFFSKKSQNEEESFINAQNEFIKPSMSGNKNSLEWGKMCPLPSAPPLKTSDQSAFTSNLSRSENCSTKPKLKKSKAKKVSQAKAATSSEKVKPSSSNLQIKSMINGTTQSNIFSCLGQNSVESKNSSCKLENKELNVDNKKSKKISNENANKKELIMQSKMENSKDVTSHCNGSYKAREGNGFASKIDKVKNCGWYWGPISGEAAEKVLSSEPDGSFIVRDSSDHHHIFSLTFKLKNVTRHVRIEHDQGSFSFGGLTRFKSQTIVDFIEKAVEHSRSGRYLFFLHRRPVLGPMRVQLLHPVSRFKHVQSLQHLCRFVIVKEVRKDLIPNLPLPQRIQDYLNSPHYYSEQIEQCMPATKAAIVSPKCNGIPRSEACFSLNGQLENVSSNRLQSEAVSVNVAGNSELGKLRNIDRFHPRNNESGNSGNRFARSRIPQLERRSTPNKKNKRYSTGCVPRTYTCDFPLIESKQTNAHHTKKTRRLRRSSSQSSIDTIHKSKANSRLSRRKIEEKLTKNHDETNSNLLEARRFISQKCRAMSESSVYSPSPTDFEHSPSSDELFDD